MKRKSSPALMLAAVLLLPLPGAVPGPLKVGEKAPDFTLREVRDGREITLSKVLASARLTVVLWIGVECSFSNACNEDYRRLQDDYAGRGVALLALNSNDTESREEVRAHALEAGFPFPVLKDDRNVVADRFDAQFTPEVWVLDAAGIARFHGGLISRGNDKSIQKDLTTALEALLKGEEPPRTETRAFGCTITRVIGGRAGGNR
jgi:peroxiredoxin